MSQTKRKVKIRQHIAQLHIKTQAVNCPNFKRKKAEPDLLAKSSTKNDNSKVKIMEEEDETVTERMEREEQDREFRELHDTTWVSKETSETKTTALVDIICNAEQLPLDDYNQALKSRWVSEAEHTKLQDENMQLKKVRDALGRSNKNALADRNTFIKKVEVLEGRIEKAVQGDFEFLWKEYGLASDENLTKDAICLKRLLFGAVEKVGLKRLTELEERLEAIDLFVKKLNQKYVEQFEAERANHKTALAMEPCAERDDLLSHSWGRIKLLKDILEGLGVLLSEPKNEDKQCPDCKGTGLDPNTYDEHIMGGAFHMYACKCKRCKGTGKAEPKELDQKMDICKKNNAYACLKSGCEHAEAADGQFICHNNHRGFKLEEPKGEADLTSTEASDVKVSREEIRQGKAKKFANTDALLKELKEGK